MGNCQNSDHGDGLKAHEQETANKESSIIMKTITWSRDSHGLFDYEARDVIQTDFKIKSPARYYRKGNEVHQKSGATGIRSDNEAELFSIKRENDEAFMVSPSQHLDQNGSDHNKPESESADEAVWLVLKSLRNNHMFPKGYPLKEGDIIKVGRVRFRVKEMCADAENRPVKKRLSEGGAKNVFVARPPPPEGVECEGQKVQPICRICLMEGAEEGNPLVNPCSCSGTMKYVHITCLQQWLKSRFHIKNTAVAFTIAWKTLDCELCSKAFPSIIEYENTYYYPLEMPKTQAKTYIVLEVLNKNTMHVKGLNFINMSTKNTIRLGRGHESDVRIADISVSRSHASLTFDQGNFYINDNDSKFGSLIQIRNAFPLIPDLNNVMIQVGRTVTTFAIPQKQSVATFSKNLSGTKFEFNTDLEESNCADERSRNILNQLVGKPSTFSSNNFSEQQQPVNGDIEEMLYESPPENNNRFQQEAGDAAL